MPMLAQQDPQNLLFLQPRRVSISIFIYKARLLFAYNANGDFKKEGSKINTPKEKNKKPKTGETFNFDLAVMDNALKGKKTRLPRVQSV
jgi:hypothetical protein